MSFVSAGFLFAFLPLALIGFHAIRGASAARWRGRWLLFASAVFYCCSGLNDVLVLLGSLALNFLIAKRRVGLNRLPGGELSPTVRRRWLAVAVAANLALLIAYKENHATES